MKERPLTRISSTTREICIKVLLTGEVLYMERVFLYCHGPTEHTAALVGSILQVLGVLWSFWSGYCFSSFFCNSAAATPTLDVSVCRTKQVSSGQEASILALVAGTP